MTRSLQSYGKIVAQIRHKDEESESELNFLLKSIVIHSIHFLYPKKIYVVVSICLKPKL